MWNRYTIRSLTTDDIVEVGSQYRYHKGDIRVYASITDVLFITVHRSDNTGEYLLLKIIQDLSYVNETIDFVNKCHNTSIPKYEPLS